MEKRSSRSLRLFVALWPLPSTRAVLGAMQRSLAWPNGARQVPPTDLHLTLAFLGAVPADRFEAVCAAVALPSANVVTELGRIDVWKGGIVVLRPSAVPSNLIDLQARLVASMQSVGVPFDARPFAPHVTLARQAKEFIATRTAPIIWRSAGHVLAVSAEGRYSVAARFN